MAKRRPKRKKAAKRKPKAAKSEGDSAPQAREPAPQAEEKAEQEAGAQAPAEAPEEPRKRKRSGAIRFVCVQCGGDLVRNRGGTYSPAWLIRKFRCLSCGRTTDQYVEERKTIAL